MNLLHGVRRTGRQWRTKVIRWAGSWTDRPWKTADAPLAPRRLVNLPATYRQDLPALDVRRRTVVVNGQLRAICEVQGVPMSVWSASETEGFLRRWAALLNALKPKGVQFVARSREGALRAAVVTRRADAQADALVPYKEMGLASARHLEALMVGGDARALEFYLVVPGRRETDVDADVTTYANLFGRIGMGLRRLEEPELSLRLAAITRPDIPTHWTYELGSMALYGEPGAAYVAGRGKKLTMRGWQ